MTLVERCARIEMLVLDVDGVLTDGRIVYTDAGEELKAFHVRDGSGLKLWASLGKKAGIITGRRSPIVERRAKELDIAHVMQGVEDKYAAFLQMLCVAGVTAEQTCALGDDVVDLSLLRGAGIAVTVADACAEAKEDADYATTAPGGRGAVRETIEWILRAQGNWQRIVERCRRVP